jgi:23S rRNA pseudouridine1911/1915/1917 synthase
MSDSGQILRIEIPVDQAGRRLDQVLAQLRPEVTRSQWQQWIEDGRVLLNGELPRKRDRLAGGETVTVAVPPPEPSGHAAEDIPLDVVYEDDSILVINKPPGLVAHPGAGNPEGTLLNALLHHVPALDTLPRAGIVHRLDKDTSGLLVVAKTETARQSLIAQLQDRSMSREYQAILNGVMIAGTTVDAPIGRHHADRTRMAVTGSGRPAVSHVRVVRKFRAHTQVAVRLESGRTHQIRVHMAHIKFPVFGDPVYGGRARLPKDAGETLIRTLQGFKRQALHAARLGLIHPETGERMEWSAPLPADMQELVAALERDARGIEHG